MIPERRTLKSSWTISSDFVTVTFDCFSSTSGHTTFADGGVSSAISGRPHPDNASGASQTPHQSQEPSLKQFSSRAPSPSHLASVAGRGALAYRTNLGTSLIGDSENLLRGEVGAALKGKVQLVFTSPPFPLNRKKKYDNRQGEEFRNWLAGFGPLLGDLLTPTGSIVIEMGNAWEPGHPVMSTLAIESLLELKRVGGFFLCQEFIWHNPARIPSPAQWVTVERIRVKDSFTRFWWLSRTERPKADNCKVLIPYSDAMKALLRRRQYNAGGRPSEHHIGVTSFLKDNGGAIPPSVLGAGDPASTNLLSIANTGADRLYATFCSGEGYAPHPARMPRQLPEFFLKLCTDEGDLVCDPFGGSNTSGAVSEELKRRWVSMEVDANYAHSGIVRFAHLTSVKAPRGSNARLRRARDLVGATTFARNTSL